MRAIATQGVSSPVVELRGIAKQYGPVAAVRPLDLDIGRGEFLAILGPSGCGKTTLLRMIGGFVEPSAGSIVIDGEDVTFLGPNRRPTNMVFQGYGLFPHMTVAQNIAYGLHIARRPRPEIADRVAEVLALVHMDGFGDRPVTQLSGGQAQRVALARALVMRPKVLLLDEPLAALDLKLRKAMQQELRSLHAATGGTFVFVTHDQEEAMGLAGRICVMEAGSIIQNGSPEEIYSHPRSRFVSTFIGEANVLRGIRQANQVRLTTGACFADEGPDEAVVCVVRPEKLLLSPAEPDAPFPAGALVHKGILEDAVFLGPFVKYVVQLDNGDTTIIGSHDMEMRRRLRIGQPVLVAWRPVDQRVLSDR